MDHPRRRLSDKIIDAHAKACADGKIEVAELLMRALETDLSAAGGPESADHRKSLAILEEAYRLHEQAKAAQGR